MLHGRIHWVMMLAGIAAVIGLPAMLPAYPRFVVTLSLLNIIAVVGLGLVMGYAGLVSLGHAGFTAIGAYATALLTTSAGFSYWIALPAAIVLACLVGFVVGLPALRLEPLYLAMVTFGFGQSVFLVVLNWASLTRGPNGLRILAPEGFAGRLTSEDMYWVVVVAAIAAVMVAHRIVHARPGRALMGLRESEVAAVTAGVNPRAYKTLAFSLSAAYAGLAGGLYVGTVRFITPDSFVFPVSLLNVTMAVVGGMGSLIGSIGGAFLLTVLPEMLRGFAEYRELLAGAILLIFLVFLPHGMAGFLLPHLQHLRSGVTGLRGARTAAGGGLGREESFTETDVGAAAGALPSRVGEPSRGETGVLLRVQGVSKAFGGVVALKDVSLDVRGGAIHGLIGPNGSGKTTLFNVITRLYAHDRGAIWLDQTDLLGVAAWELARLGVARTFQNLELFPRISVLENVLIGMHVHIPVTFGAAVAGTPAARRAEQEARQEARRWLSFVGFEGSADLLAGTLPFGRQRLVEIARALASRPRLLLLDEPSAGLTFKEMASLAEMIHRIRDTLGITIVLVAHTMRLVLGLSDVVTVLDHGVKIAEGSPDEVRTNPDVIQAYLGEQTPQDAPPPASLDAANA